MNSIRFLHVRAIQNGQVQSRGGETYAYRAIAPNRVEYAVARCSDKDNFVKRFGRTIAAGRLASPNYRQVWEGSVEQFKGIVFDV